MVGVKDGDGQGQWSQGMGHGRGSRGGVRGQSGLVGGEV